MSLRPLFAVYAWNSDLMSLLETFDCWVPCCGSDNNFLFRQPLLRASFMSDARIGQQKTSEKPRASPIHKKTMTSYIHIVPKRKALRLVCVMDTNVYWNHIWSVGRKHDQLFPLALSTSRQLLSIARTVKWKLKINLMPVNLTFRDGIIFLLNFQRNNDIIFNNFNRLSLICEASRGTTDINMSTFYYLLCRTRSHV